MYPQRAKTQDRVIVISYRGHKTEMFFVPSGEAGRFEINRGFIWAESTNVTLPTDRLICRGGQFS